MIVIETCYVNLDLLVLSGHHLMTGPMEPAKKMHFFERTEEIKLELT